MKSNLTFNIYIPKSSYKHPMIAETEVDIRSIQVDSELYLAYFKRDIKSFWRFGKPVKVCTGDILCSNSAIAFNHLGIEDIFLVRFSLKKLKCFINEQLNPTLKDQLPDIISEWPELILRCDELTGSFDYQVLIDFVNESERKSIGHEQCRSLLSLFFSQLDFELFSALENLKELNTSSRQELVQKVALVNNFMKENLDSSLSLQSLASLVDYSQYHFQRKYKQALGISPTRKLSNLRLTKALTLIKNSDRRLSEIASQLGYSDLPTFSKAFKRYHGKSPQNFLKKI